MPAPTKNQVRIIGGTHKRRILRFAEAAGSEGLRPTPDRVRETLFNWLGQDLDGKICLDAFAGSGALAFEAASRSAARVIAVEMSRLAAQAMTQNNELLQLKNLRILNGDAFAFMASTTERFDVLFLDPPFARDDWAKLAPLVSKITAPLALVYCEFARELTSFGDSQSFERVKHAKAGLVHYHLFRKSDATALAAA